MFTFHKYAGDKGYLIKEDLRILMDKEFPGFLEVSVRGLRKDQT
jgi:calpactin-1 light chain